MPILPQEIQAHRPEPLGSRIQGENDCRNVNQSADLIAVAECPLDELPEGLRQARQKMDEADRAKSEAQGEMREKLSDWTRYQNLVTELGLRRQNLSWAEMKLAIAKHESDSLRADFMTFKNVAGSDWPTAVAMVQNVLLCRELIKLLPLWIEQEAAAILKIETEVNMLAEKYGE